MKINPLAKTREEISKARIAGHLAAQVLRMIGEHVRAGITTLELDRICHDYIVNELDAIPANVGYMGYQHTACISLNHVVCHGIPSDRKLKNGDILNIDVALIKDGWYGDTSRMFTVGDPGILAKRLIDTTYEAMMAGTGRCDLAVL